MTAELDVATQLRAFGLERFRACDADLREAEREHAAFHFVGELSGHVGQARRVCVDSRVLPKRARTVPVPCP
ncbi:MAG: hypothetical protein H6720_03555 [Sandaracinus sp.]|nr:hypothetical protein [Sandaracinus sp.]